MHLCEFPTSRPRPTFFKNMSAPFSSSKMSSLGGMVGRVAETAAAPSEFPSVLADILKRGGEVGQLMLEMDWSKTALGPPHQWPLDLVTSINMMMVSRFPIIVLWGPQLIGLYNDAYTPIFGKSHPKGLGKPTTEVRGVSLCVSRGTIYQFVDNLAFSLLFGFCWMLLSLCLVLCVCFLCFFCFFVRDNCVNVCVNVSKRNGEVLCT